MTFAYSIGCVSKGYNNTNVIMHNLQQWRTVNYIFLYFYSSDVFYHSFGNGMCMGGMVLQEGC